MSDAGRRRESAYERQKAEEAANRKLVRGVLENLAKATNLVDVLDCIRAGAKLGLKMLDDVETESQS